MNHLTPDQLSALVDDALTGDALDDARAHLGGCTECRDALAKLQAQDDALFAAKAAMPDDAYFDSFAARVQERIGETRVEAGAATPIDDSRPVEGAPPPRSAGAPWWTMLFGWFQSPGRLAWAGGAAVVVVGAGLAFMTMRETGVPMMRDTEVGDVLGEAEQTAPRAKQSAGETQGLAKQGSESDDREAGARQGPAPPSRAREMRRTETGEDVPVDRDAPRFAQEPREEAAAPSTAGEPAYVRRPQVAQPLAGRTASDAEGKDAAKEETSKALALESTISGSQVCGEVHDAANRPLAGAQVVLADHGVTTTTDTDGRFCMESPAGAQTLSVMAVGFETVRRTIDVGVSTEPLAVKLDAVDVLGKAKASGSASALPPSALAPGGARRAFDEDALQAPEDAVVAMREAQRLTTLAEENTSASRWDKAAEAWARAVALLPDGDTRIEALYRAAGARKKALDMTPTDIRKSNARKAFEDYLKSAPAGVSRARVESWKAALDG